MMADGPILKIQNLISPSNKQRQSSEGMGHATE